MSNVDFIREYLGRGIDIDRSAEYFSDDFQWSDSIGSPPSGRDAYLGLGSVLIAALPDLEYIVEDMQEDGDDVLVTAYWTGTFMNDLDLSAAGMGVIPATGAAVRWPSTSSRWSVAGGKITGIRDLTTGPDAGIAGFVKALGANVG